jgi:hypothetical protein
MVRMPAARNNLLVRLVTPGGDDPLLLRLVAPDSIVNGSPFGSVIRLAGSGGAGGYAYSIVTGSLPTGLSLNGSTGVISGTPSAVGLFSFVAQVQDSAASVYTASFSLRVRSRLSVYGKLPPLGEEFIDYIGQFRVIGNTGTVTWSLIDGNLPAGLSMDSAGQITGTPVGDSNGLVGTSYFTVRATDGGSGDTLEIPHSIVIYESLNFDTFNIPDVIRGTYYEYQFPTVGGVQPFTFDLIGNPFTTSRMKFNVRTGLLSGTTGIPSGNYIFGIRVTDALGATKVLFDVFVVRDANQTIQPQIGGVDIGSANPSTINFEDGTGTTAEVTNTGGIVTVKFNTTPGSGGVGSIGGATPDSSGNVGIGSSDDSIVATVDSNGELDLRVNPETRAPMAGFGNGSLTLTGTMTLEIPYMKYGGTITGWHIVGNTAGDVSITVSRAPFASYDTMTTLFTATCSGSLTAVNPVPISHDFFVGDVLRFSATGFSGFTRCAIVLDVA